MLAASLTNTYLLHTVLTSIELPLAELSVNNLVAIDAPANSHPHFEHKLLKAIAKIRNMGPHVAVIVQPSLRKKTQRSTWVYTWNQMKHTPFKYRQTCSCCLGDGSPGCHFVYFIGRSFPVALGTCAEVPTLGATPEATLLSLTTALLSLSLDLSEQIFIRSSQSQDCPAPRWRGPRSCQTQKVDPVIGFTLTTSGLEPRALRPARLNVTWVHTTHNHSTEA